MPYFGSARVENQGFILRSEPQIIDYSTQLGTSELVQLFRAGLKEATSFPETAWFPVRVDVTNIVGLAEQYYRLNKNATKSSFLGDGSDLSLLLFAIRACRVGSGVQVVFPWTFPRVVESFPDAFQSFTFVGF